MGNQSANVGGTRPSDRFSDHYVMGDRLGSGTFAVVKKCYRKKEPNLFFAVKIVDKRHLTPRELVGLKYEVKILQTMEHPCVIKAVDVFEDKHKVKMVLELCEGGDLFDYLLKSKGKRLDEKKAAWITCKLARALKYLHEHHVCHRDIKPENILFTKTGGIKITDFGLAHYLKLPPSVHIMHTCCGTPHYVAPEVLGSEEYSVEVDFWSLGVVLYLMLSGTQPFNSKSIRAMYSMITRGQYRFPKMCWDPVSPEAISCIKGLMNVNPRERLNCETLCKHPFIVNNVDLKEIEREESLELQEQHVLMKGSCSQLLPEGFRLPYNPNAVHESDDKESHDTHEVPAPSKANGKTSSQNTTSTSSNTTDQTNVNTNVSTSTDDSTHRNEAISVTGS